MRNPISIDAIHSRAIAAEIGERLASLAGRREGTSTLPEIAARPTPGVRGHSHVPLTRMRPHPDAQTRVQPFVRDFAIELLGEKLDVRDPSPPGSVLP